MLEFFSKLFNTADFPARWHCGLWSPEHGWTHIISDFAIAGAYAAIPILLVYFALRRRDVPFVPLFWLFAAFILFCGLGHFAEGVIFWFPWYRFSAVVKACTAIVSWMTVIALIPILPKALSLPGLATVNRRLESEVADRRLTEKKLQQSYDELQGFMRQTLDREDRMLELKQEVNELLSQLGHQARYQIPENNG